MSKVTLAAFLRPAETVEEEPILKHPSKPKTKGNINDNIENNIKKGKQKQNKPEGSCIPIRSNLSRNTFPPSLDFALYIGLLQ